MCGIFSVHYLKGEQKANRERIYKLAKRLRHRGPDSYKIDKFEHSENEQTFMVHKRLAIVAPGESGEQPLYTDSGKQTCFIANGEIYNHQKLRETFNIEHPNKSDCQVIGHVYEKFGALEFSKHLDGMFATVIEDRKTGRLIASRDHMGKIPMYMAKGKDGSFWFASEMKCLHDDPGVESYQLFPPGHVWVKEKNETEGTMTRWYDERWITDVDYIPEKRADLSELREIVVKAVKDRLMSDVPYAVLLSGGLDSSLITSIAVRNRATAKNTYGSTEKVHSFSIGIKGAPDLKAARKVADSLGTIHHEIYFTPEEALDALPDVVWHLETFEQVRASVPMYLLSRAIKSMGFKMVLSGEGADELFGGYLYFHKAPSPEEFHKECARKTSRLHQWDVARANKMTMAWGVEARTPLLSKAVVDYAMNMSPLDKMIDVKKLDQDGKKYLEKYILRKAFDTPEDPYLPAEVLWRQKEQFSDGVGYDWVDGLKAHAEEKVSDEEFSKRAERFPLSPPTTKEYYLLRSIFEEHFVTGFENGQDAYKTVPFGKSIACSTPEAVAWDPEWEKSVGDISGRAVGVHDSSDGFDLGKDSAVSASSSSSSSSSSGSGSSSNVTTSSARATSSTVTTTTVAALNNKKIAAASRKARHSRRLPGGGGIRRGSTKAIGFISQVRLATNSSSVFCAFA